MRFWIALAAFYSGIVFGQGYPSKPIRFIVTFPPGGSADLMARALAPGLSSRLGQQVIVENRPGAGGNLGMEALAKSTPDGHTIGLGAAGALSANVSLYRNMPFHPEKDLAPVSMVALIPFFLVANPGAPVANLQELLHSEKAKDGTLAYGHGGNGSAMHLCGELLNLKAGLKLQAIAYKGSGPVATDVLGGQVPLGFVDVPSSIANVRAGKLRALAVTTRQRVSAAPEVPTFAEAGLPGYEAIGWFGMVVPAATPREVIERLNRATVESLSAPEFRSRAIAAGAEPMGSTPQEFAAFIHEEIGKWAEVIKTAKVTID
jgi:tripartite-type tricarboxylate transporter receptor subunit TctC